MAKKSAKTSLRYRPAVVTFLDILGFGQLVKQESASKVQEVLAVVSKFVAKVSRNPYSPQAFAFSDSIVRVRHIDGLNALHPTGLLFSEILDIVHAQAELVPHNVILRGAITVGEIYADGSTVFGPALVRAYELETKTALYPRVVIDPHALNQLRQDAALRAEHHSVKEEVQCVRDLLRRGENGSWFVDYLHSFSPELDEPAMEPDFLRMHRDLVLLRYQAAGNNTAFLDKLLWLALYHNKCVSLIPFPKLKQWGVKRTDLEIKTADMAELARMPLKSK